jgi:hypothetical protein
MQPFGFKFITIAPCCGGHQITYLSKLLFQHTLSRDIKIPLSLSQASSFYDPNAFTLILSLSEGRAGNAWGPSSKMMLVLPQEIKCLISSPVVLQTSTLVLSPKHI